MSLAEANRQYFDSISSSYDTKPWFAKVNNQVTAVLRADLSWVGIPFTDTSPTPVRLLDYACGTGLMTRIFGPYVTTTQGLDISPNMITTYNTRAREAGLSEQVVSGAVGDLFDKTDHYPEKLSAPRFFDFDLATVGFGFHHFEDVRYAAGKLRERLRPGGVLVINDFLEGGDVLAGEDGEPVVGSEGDHAVHAHGHGHGHGNKNDGGSAHGHGHHDHDHDHHDDDAEKKYDVSDSTPEFRKKMQASVVVPHFTIEGVKKFFTEAGFVDVDVITMKERAYMEFGGKKMWRTILFAKGRRPFESEEKSEL